MHFLLLNMYFVHKGFFYFQKNLKYRIKQYFTSSKTFRKRTFKEYIAIVSKQRKCRNKVKKAKKIILKQQKATKKNYKQNHN